jgi:hypothetical protein
MLQKNAHETSATEVPMVKSYDVLKLGYFYGENVKNPFSTIKSGYFLTSGDDIVCHNAKELTRTFQDHVEVPCGSSMVLRYDGCNVMQQLFAHLFGTIFSTFQSQNRSVNVRYLYLLMVDGYGQTDWPRVERQSVVIPSAWFERLTRRSWHLKRYSTFTPLFCPNEQ